MGSESTAAERWRAWCDRSRSAAAARWDDAEKLNLRTMRGKTWLLEIRKRLVELMQIGILAPREQTRIKELDWSELAGADRKRIGASGLSPRALFAVAVAPEDAEPLAECALRLNPGRRLGDGKLSLQCFIDDNRSIPVGMNIQICGTDPAREGRPVYIRYDLDVVAMGERAGPVTHFNAHWHMGDDSVARDAEDHDPRLPSLRLDPLAVLDILIETFFPRGPDDVI